MAAETPQHADGVETISVGRRHIDIPIADHYCVRGHGVGFSQALKLLLLGYSDVAAVDEVEMLIEIDSFAILD